MSRVDAATPIAEVLYALSEIRPDLDTQGLTEDHCHEIATLVLAALVGANLKVSPA